MATIDGRKSGRVLGLKGTSPTAIHVSILKGLSVTVLARFVKDSGLPEAAVLTVMGLAPRTLARRRRDGTLNPDESDRLYRLADLHRKAVELFEGNTAAAAAWLQRPRPIFDGRTPLDMARTEVGAAEVLRLIGRLEHGVFS